MDPLDPEAVERHDRLIGLLRDQEASEQEIAEWLPVLARLDGWPERHVTATDRQQLLSTLEPLVMAASPVRLAVRAGAAGRTPSLSWLYEVLRTARTQVSLLHGSFWLVSAAVTLVGAYLELSRLDAGSVFFLQALGPLLAFFGISAAFRGIERHTLECELACPPSALQLVVARLVVVLGYDVSLAIGFGAVLWRFGGVSFLAVTLHWLMPLLLVAGCALVLSLRLPSAMAAALSYVGWLSALIIANAGMQWAARLSFAIPAGGEVAMGALGLILLCVAAGYFPRAVSRHMSAVA
jgi:hypothetical protein